MNPNIPELMKQAQALEEASHRFPLGEVVACILIATFCIACLMVLAWFLFRTRLPRSFPNDRR